MDKNKMFVGFTIFMVVLAIISGIYLMFGGKKPAPRALPQGQTRQQPLKGSKKAVSKSVQPQTAIPKPAVKRVPSQTPSTTQVPAATTEVKP